MRLTSIEIENFKGIREPQVIDLRPITLLFGPNSAGKSSVLQALHYVREILERGNADPDETVAGGRMDLGGFTALVHNHDLKRKVRVALTVELSSEDSAREHLGLNSGVAQYEADFQALMVWYLLGKSRAEMPAKDVRSVSVELVTEWSDRIQGAFVSKIGIGMDGVPLASILSPIDKGRAILTDFNFSHPLIGAIDGSEEAGLSWDEADEMPDMGLQEEDLSDDPMICPLAVEVWELSRDVSYRPRAPVLTSVPRPSNLPPKPPILSPKVFALSAAGVRNPEFSVGVETKVGALPDLYQPLALDLRDQKIPDFGKYDEHEMEEFAEELHRRNGLKRLLTELVLGPLRIVHDYLTTLTYIGPLRDIPKREFRPKAAITDSRWAGGLAAWDLLYADQSGNLREKVNHWLSDSNRLGTNYQVERVLVRQVEATSRFHQLFERGLTDDDLGELQESYEALSFNLDVFLRDLKNGVIVTPQDVGVGISQMIPVVVACVRDVDSSLVAIEQPELHVHPAVQVGLGDLFIEAIQADDALGTGKSLLIETHSEHMILRLLRRIRETTEQELPPGVVGLRPEELAVVFIEPLELGVRFRQLRVDENGRFLDRWPRGFFEERAEELFS